MEAKYWKEGTINFGEKPTNTTINVIFQSTEDIPDILDIRPECGCTLVKYDEKNKTLTAVYRSKDIPYHLKKYGFYSVKKYITIDYKNGEHDVLTLHGIIKDK